jgi:hypothetical protein
MPKKARRAKRRRRRKHIPSVKRKRITTKPKERVIDLSEEYRYVISDLKRIAILAGAMLALLIILSLLIR